MSLMKTFYNCRCFSKRNIFVKKYKTHFVFENDEQFKKQYKWLLEKVNCETEIQDLIREIKDELRRRENIEENTRLCCKLVEESYRPVNPRIFCLQEDFFDPSFLKICAFVASSSNREEILPVIDIISEDKQLYGFPLFTKETCDELVSEIDNFKSFHFPRSQPNSMNHHGILLEEIGLYKGFVDPLRENYIAPIAGLLFPEWCGTSGLDSHRAFTVCYEPGKDEDLDMHYDNAEVTLNVCIGKDFSEGELYFNGMRTDLHTSEPSYEVVPHKIGYAVVHRSQQLHGTLPVSDGQRQNLIIWMRSSSIRNKKCPMCDQTPDLSPAYGYGDGFLKEPSRSCCIS